MARAPATATPILLGEAYKQYSKEDEDRTRKLIEQAIRDITNSTNTNNSIIQAGDLGGGFFPTSPILAETSAAGDASHPSRVQWLNPVASGKKVKIYELYMSMASAGSTPLVRGIRTNSPQDMTTGGGYVTANLLRLDPEDTTPPVSIVSAAAKGSVIAAGSEDFYGSGPLEGQSSWRWIPIRLPGTFPITLLEGEAVEFTSFQNGTTEKIRIMGIADEILL